MKNILSSIEEIFNQYAPCVFIEVLKTGGGGTPCKPGFKMIVDKTGRIDGSIGGGILEQTCINIAKRMITKNEKINIYNFDLKNDIPYQETNEILTQIDNINRKDLFDEQIKNDKITLNAACGGVVTIFFEFFDTLTLSIFGAGHIGQNLVDIIKKIGYKIQLFDIREDFLNQFLGIDEVKKYLLKPIEKDNVQLFYVDEKPLSDFLQDGSFIVITTHGHAYDFSIAKYILSTGKKFKYIGMVASRNKVSQFVEKLKSDDKNIYENFLSSNFYSPIGLDIGGVSAREIALSIASQIQSIRYGKNINCLSII